jgi:hypothetical protein
MEFTNQELTDRIVQVPLTFTFTAWNQEVEMMHRMSRKPQFWTEAGKNKPAVVFGVADSVKLRLKAVSVDGTVISAADPLIVIVRAQ